jgi:unconventional prefoldin RPB5 interactor 1
LKFSEKKEEARRKRKSGGGHAAHELPMIKTPADIYR